MVHVYSSNSESDSRWQVGKQFVTILLVVGVLSVLIISGYSFYKRLKTPISPAIDAIPTQAACIIKINDWFDFSEKLKKNKLDIWTVFFNQTQGKAFQKKILFLDSIFKTDDDVVLPKCL